MPVTTRMDASSNLAVNWSGRLGGVGFLNFASANTTKRASKMNLINFSDEGRISA